MEKLRKIALVIIALFLIVLTVNVKTYAATKCNIGMNTAKNEYTAGEQVVVEVKINNLSTDKGIIAMGATLEYNSKALKYEKMRGDEEWSNPQYNASNGKLTVLRSELTKSNETVFKITFTVLEGAQGNIDIKLNNCTVSGGDGDYGVGTAKKTITVKEKEQEPPKENESSKPTEPSNPSKPSKPNNSASTTKKPDTPEENNEQEPEESENENENENQNEINENIINENNKAEIDTNIFEEETDYEDVKLSNSKGKNILIYAAIATGTVALIIIAVLIAKQLKKIKKD